MKHTTILLGSVAAVLAGASIYLGLQLADSRQRLAQETAARSADEERIRQLEGQRLHYQASLSQDRMVDGPASGTAAVPAPPATNPRVADHGPPDGFVPPWGRGQGRGDGRSDFDDSPAGRHARLVQEEVRLRRMYADMPKALGLDPAQADKLFNLLADRQMAAEDAERAYSGDRAGRQALEAQQAEDLSTAIQDMFGAGKADEFQQYQQSVPARRQVDRVGESMAAANAPLSDAQRESLITAMVAEQQAVPRPQRPADGGSNADYQAQFLDWQADYSARVQARVEPLLTPQQQATYREQVELQNARRANQRARVQAQQSAPQTSPLKQ
jgi:hypothetical protein